MDQLQQLSRAFEEFKQIKQRIPWGCVKATNWLCSRVEGLQPIRLTRYMKNGEVYQHVVATDAEHRFRIDIAPYADAPDE